MGLLSDHERSEFQWELRFKTEEQLTALFNELSETSENERVADNERGKAIEKRELVQTALDLRRRGGALG